jgi:hypothetical protein
MKKKNVEKKESIGYILGEQMMNDIITAARYLSE